MNIKNKITMIQEAYVSYEIAKLLERKGFDVPCNSWYMSCGDGSVKKFMLAEPDNHNQYDGFPWIVSRPTHQMAMAWLREVHNIIIVIEPHMYDYVNEKTSSYVTSLWQGDNYYENITLKDYPTYEEAVEVTLKHILENLL